MTPKPTMNLHFRISGQYRCVLNEGTEREKDTGWMKNLVLDAGLDKMGTVANHTCYNICSVGTSATAVTAAQTSLGAFLASKTSIDGATAVNLGAPNYTVQDTCFFTFPQGAVVGNITEMGVGTGASGTVLFSRALIVDGAGVPTALTVVALDQLTVYYRVNLTPVITDLSSSFTVTGVGVVNYTGRCANITNFTSMGNLRGFVGSFGAVDSGINRVNVWGTGAALGAITTTPSGGTQVSGTSTLSGTQVYTNGTYYLDNTLVLPPADHNSTGGIKAMTIQSQHYGWRFQYLFTTIIPKDNTKTFTFTVRVSWSR